MVLDPLNFTLNIDLIYLNDVFLLGVHPLIAQEALEQEGPVPLPAEAEAAEWWMQFVGGKKVCPAFISNLWIDV
jgi:hypothetical protein